MSCIGAVSLLAGMSASAAAQVPTTGGAFWPTLEAQGKAFSKTRFTLFGGLKQGEDYSYEQWRVGGGLVHQSERFAKRHRVVDIDPAREHKLDFGAGYTYLKTTEGPKPSFENRISLAFTPRARLGAGLLLSDRNQFEFRWVNDLYSSRYRNRVGLHYVTQAGSIRFTPYTQAEFFYTFAKDAWTEQRYTFGVEWPYRDVLKLATYYTRQICQSCSPEFVNVAGVTLHYFLQNNR